MKLRFIPLIALGGALLVAGCMDSTSPTDVSPALDILDAEHGDAGSHFYFLPPMVPNPNATGIFDDTQLAVVEICEWTGLACALTITELSVAAGTIDVVDEQYHGNWHAGDFALDINKLYRISVLVGAQELGHADVQPVANGSGLKNLDTGEVIGLVDNRTLPIKFRIEEGAIDEGITFDATALSAPTFSLSGPGGTIGSFPSDTPLVLALVPGTYSVGESSSAETHEFEITAAGEVSYVAAKEPFFDGLGTSQLTLVGYSIDVDPTLVTAAGFSIGGIGGFSTATVQTFTFLPGTKSVQENSDGVHEFEVTDVGEVDYAATKEPFFDGSGTSVLTLVGYSIVIDATALSSADFFLGGIGPRSTTSPHTVVVLPGIKSFDHTDVGFFNFEVEEDGLLEYDTLLDAILSGRGTSTLTVTP